MELDDLKQTWQQTPVTNKTKNTDIMDIIQHKSYGPVAAMKRGFRKNIVFMAMLPFILILTNMDNVAGVFRSVMFWSYVAFCIGVIVFGITNYRILKSMEGMDVFLRSHLEQQILLLEKRIRQNIIGLRIVMLYFIALTEILPYFQYYRTLHAWHSLPPFARFGAYAALLALQYYASKAISRRKFGQHLNYLKELVREMQH
jgi:hypothetical protein